MAELNIGIVTIGLDRYDALTATAYENKMIRSTLWNGAVLDYSGKRLQFDDRAIDAMLKALYPADYDLHLERLKGEKDGE